MIGRQRAEFGRERGAVQVRQLFRVQLHAQTVRARGFEYAARLRGREADAFAEGVHGIGQLLARHGGHHLVAHEVDVVIRAPGEFGRQRMGTEERRHHAHPGQRARHAQALEFVLHIQPVARLDLDRGHAARCERFDARRGLRRELRRRRRARRLHGGENPATRARDFLVGRPLQAALEFLRAVACVNEVRVAIDEARRDQCPACVDAMQVIGLRGALPIEGRHRSHPGDAARARDEGARVDHRVAPARHRCDAGVDDEAVFHEAV